MILRGRKKFKIGGRSGNKKLIYLLTSKSIKWTSELFGSLVSRTRRRGKVERKTFRGEIFLVIHHNKCFTFTIFGQSLIITRIILLFVRIEEFIVAQAEDVDLAETKSGFTNDS